MKQLTRTIFVGGSLAGLVCAMLVGQVQFKYESHIFLPTEAQTQVNGADAILVLGGGINPDGSPSDALRDRLLVGISLFQQLKADTIVATGDDGKFHRNETDGMQKFLLDHGVPQQAIKVDGKGYRTYESCKNAVSAGYRRIIVVTQRFHVARAVYLCSQLGLNTDGVTSDLRSYKNSTYFWMRDLASSLKAWWDINVITPKSPV